MSRTKIEWTHRPGTKGVSWNMIAGCSEVSTACAHCYARGRSWRILCNEQHPARYNGVVEKIDSQVYWTGTVNFDLEAVSTPYRWRKPRTVFVASMSDLFHPLLSWTQIEKVFVTMTAQENRKHTFIVLTKRAKRMQEFVSKCYPGLAECSPHIWLCVTTENQARFDERVPYLLRTPSAIRGVSVEPMLEPVDPRDVPIGDNAWTNALTGRDRFVGPISGFSAGTGPHLNWVICGAETGPYARKMELQWARDLRNQCEEAHVPFFFKRAGPHYPFISADLLVRQWPSKEIT